VRPKAKVVVCSLIGAKLGNATMSWLHAFAHAARVGAEFQCDPWVGEQVFDLPPYTRPHAFRSGPRLRYPERDEFTLAPDEGDVTLRTYAQSQAAMIYTATQAREWLRLKRPIEAVFNTLEAERIFGRDHIVAHLRRGDYARLGYPLISFKSYHKACVERRLCEWTPQETLSEPFHFVSEETPTPWHGLPDALSFLPDFYRLVYAPIMLRANSSFSWVAGLLNVFGRVFAPMITPGMKGGEENDCYFVEGNWPRLSTLPMCTDLHVQP